MTTIDPSIIGDMLRDSLAKGQNPRLTVTSNSMAPLFWTKDQVILEAVQPEQLNPGDIVTIVDSSSIHDLLTHRIWTRDDHSFLTRGDHALHFDQPCSPDAILGRVMGRIHNQHVLTFQNGWGRWLDQHLAVQARREYRWLTGLQEAPSGERPVVINTQTKIIHRLFFSWAIVITFMINLATRIKPGETKI